GEQLPINTRLESRVDLSLDPNNHDERQRRDIKADPNFAERRESENLVDRWIDHVVHDRSENQNENWVCCLHLGSDQVQAHPMQVHFLRLQRPFSAVAHSPKRPEDQNKNVNHCDTSKGDKTFLAECFFQITEAGRRDVHHFLATAPEEQSSDNHRYAGNSKRPTWSPFRICQQPWTKNGGNERAGVNREIEPAKHF